MSLSTILILIPIISFSIVSVAIIIEKFFFIKNNAINLDQFKKTSFNSTKLLDICNCNSKSLFCNLIIRLYKTNFSSKDEYKEFVDGNISDIYLEFQKRLGFLGIFAKLSTLLGLFGTIIGMISAFNNIVEKGISNAGIVASGISTALITTAIGLIVAIPTTFFFDFFSNKTENEMRKMEVILSLILHHNIAKKRQ